MEIIRKYLERTTLEDFAKKHDLKFVITERPKNFNLPRYHGNFEGSPEIKDDGMLRSAYANGDSESQVIDDYKRVISGQTLVWNAYNPMLRRELKVPELI